MFIFPKNLLPTTFFLVIRLTILALLWMAINACESSSTNSSFDELNGDGDADNREMEIDTVLDGDSEAGENSEAEENSEEDADLDFEDGDYDLDNDQEEIAADSDEVQDLPESCDAGERICQEQFVFECLHDGTGWFEVLECNESETCDHGQCLLITDPQLDGDNDEEIDIPCDSYLFFESINEQSVKEGQQLVFSIQVQYSDDIDGIAISADHLPQNASFTDHLDGSGTFSFSPDYEQAGLYWIDFIAQSQILAARTRILITVVDNQPSFYLEPIENREMAAGDILQVPLYLNGFVDESLNFSITSALESSTVEKDDGGQWWLNLLPSEEMIGDFQIQITAATDDSQTQESMTLSVVEQGGLSACESVVSYVFGDKYFTQNQGTANYHVCEEFASSGYDRSFGFDVAENERLIIRSGSTDPGHIHVLYLLNSCDPQFASCFEYRDSMYPGDQFYEIRTDFDGEGRFFAVIDNPEAPAQIDDVSGSSWFMILRDTASIGETCEFPAIPESGSVSEWNLTYFENSLDHPGPFCFSDDQALPDGADVAFHIPEAENERIEVIASPIDVDFDPMLIFSEACPVSSEYCLPVIDFAGPGEDEVWQNDMFERRRLFMFVDSQSGNEGRFSFKYRIIPCAWDEIVDIQQPIPDNLSSGLSLEFPIAQSFPVDQVRIHFKVFHPRFSDLLIRVTSPSSAQHVLFDHANIPIEEVEMTETIDAFAGEEITGMWTIEFIDDVAQRVGRLDQIEITFNPSSCEELHCQVDEQCPPSYSCIRDYCASTE